MMLNVNGKGPEPEDDVVDLRKSPMALINDISRLMGDRIRANSDNPITQKSGRLLLMELAKKDGKTQLDLVRATHLKAPTISVSLQKLERDGYVKRTPDEYDLRATRVYLTEKGKELDNTLRKVIKEQEDTAVDMLTPSEIETLVKILEKIKSKVVSDVTSEDEDF